MTLDEDVKKLEGLYEATGHDQEEMHIQADGILLKYVPDEIKTAYKKLREIGFWYA